MRGKHNIQYIWCELFPEDCLSLIVQLQPKYSDAGQPASSCYCSTVWASSLVEKEKEREREGETDFSLPFISVPCFPLCSLSEHPAPLHSEVLWCVLRCADVALLVSHVALSQLKGADTGLHRLTARGLSDGSSAWQSNSKAPCDMRSKDE